MTKNEIVGRLRDGGLDASSTNRSAAVYVADAMAGRAVPGWFAYRIVCDSEATERRARAILSRWYDIEASGNVWRLRSKNRVPLMAIKRGGVPPTPPTPPTGDYLYFEAAEANSTVSMMSMLATAPNLEYSTDGVTWQEWQHTTADDVHTFDTITLSAVGDKVYLRGDNPEGISADEAPSMFHFTGKIKSGGSVTSLIDGDGVSLTEIPEYGLEALFCSGDPENPDTSLLTPPTFGNVTSVKLGGCVIMYQFCSALESGPDMSKIISVEEGGCNFMFSYSSLTSAVNLSSLQNIGTESFALFYGFCNFNMSDDGTTLNFDFPTPPITTTGDDPQTYSTAYDIAQWMGNTNGFTEP